MMSVMITQSAGCVWYVVKELKIVWELKNENYEKRNTCIFREFIKYICQLATRVTSIKFYILTDFNRHILTVDSSKI